MEVHLHKEYQLYSILHCPSIFAAAQAIFSPHVACSMIGLIQEQT